MKTKQYDFPKTSLKELKERRDNIFTTIEKHAHELDEKEFIQLRRELTNIDIKISAEEQIYKSEPGFIKINNMNAGGKCVLNAII
jgi:hypothetical protein